MTEKNPTIIPREPNPFDEPRGRVYTTGDHTREEVQLANRNSGIMLEMLRHDVTPAGAHYLLNHFDVPYVPDKAAWRLDVGGLVERPLSLSIADIEALPATTLRVTMECAGNGRANALPRPASQPWLYEAVGTAEWTGTSLRHVLERAGLRPDVVEVSFHGADRGYDRHEHDYGRSLVPEMAMHPDVLLVWAMNGQPLLPQHGYPLRMIVPGWYGMASVKWLSRIEALASPYQGHQQVGTYHYRQTADEQGIPVTHIRVKSLIAPPGVPDWYTRRRLVRAGTVTLEGRAWSGNGQPVTRVEVAIEGRWQDAQVEAKPAKYAWQRWSLAWQATPGDYEIMCRATDASGATQPLEPVWDRGGFGNNVVHRQLVSVR
jgi:DMSO/TMAO reductase YedYZ molybdopterin-dependent catalytic subunit